MELMPMLDDVKILITGARQDRVPDRPRAGRTR
jgi:hypothetical protein